MATKELVTKVWIEEGCIVCDACETASPEVFEVLDETCIIRPAALSAEFTKPRTDSIIEAAEECPTDVIKYETVSEEVAAAGPEGAPDESASGAEEAPPQESAPKESAPKESAPKESAPKESAPKESAPKKAPPEKEKAPAVAAKADESGKKTEKKADPAAKPVKEPEVSVAGAPDPAIKALLEAATARGGSAGIMKKAASIPESARQYEQTKASDLPPDARQAKVLEEARKMKKKDPDERRRAVAGGAAVAAGWALFAGGSAVATVAVGRFMMPNVLEEPDPRVRVGKLGRYEEMQPGEVNEDYKPQGIWMIREEGRIAALSIICTHLGCIPNWLPNDRKFKCPCHGSGYYFNGINFEGPTPRPLERFRVYVEDGLVIVDKSKKFQQELGQWDMPGSFIEV